MVLMQYGIENFDPELWKNQLNEQAVEAGSPVRVLEVKAKAKTRPGDFPTVYALTDTNRLVWFLCDIDRVQQDHELLQECCTTALAMFQSVYR